MNITSIDAFINKCFNAIAKNLQEPTDKIINFFKNILKIKPSICVNFDNFGNPIFALNFAPNKTNQISESVLNLPKELANNGYNIIVVFDEF